MCINMPLKKWRTKLGWGGFVEVQNPLDMFVGMEMEKIVEVKFEMEFEDSEGDHDDDDYVEPSNHEMISIIKTHDQSVQTSYSHYIDIGIQVNEQDNNHFIDNNLNLHHNQCQELVEENLNQRYHYDPEELSIQLFQHYGDEKIIEKEMRKRKSTLEYNAEKAARVRQAQWVRDRISLEKAIDDLFSDQIVLHEKAHALRLHFEREKLLWSQALESNIQNLKSQQRTRMNPRESNLSQTNREYSQKNSQENPFETAPDPNRNEDEFEYFHPVLEANRNTTEVTIDPSCSHTNISPQNCPVETHLRLPSTKKFRFPSKTI